MTYTAIPDANIASGKPIREVDGLLLRDNPIAMMNGDSGAPRLQDAALYTGAATAARNTWVRNGYAISAVMAIGTYAFLYYAGSASPGDTVAGSALEWAGLVFDSKNTTGGTNTNVYSTGTAPSGTWRCMGYCANPASFDNATLWLRIS